MITVQKVPDTRRGDDGVQISTPRSRNEVDGALWTVILYHFFFEHLSNHARVSLATGFLHDLANQEADSLILAVLVVDYGLGIFSDGFFNQLQDSTLVAYLFQAQLLNQSLGRLDRTSVV